MTPTQTQLLDGNEAAARIAYRLSETIAIYPITPSTPMAEHCDEWSAKGQTNLFGTVPSVTEMQSEAGAAGALHGMLQGGTLSTTFTASQGLLLMIPNMYKLAGELHPFVMHVTARTIATHALSIFGDHSDVMACRQTGFAMLASNSVQEAQDMAVIAHLATLKTRIPFMHFFDGFRTSHEINQAELVTDEQLKKLLDPNDLTAFRSRALTPDAPTVRGTAQNPDVFFQAREAINPFYCVAPETIKEVLDQFEAVTGRSYQLFEYVGHPEAEEVTIAMGSSVETLEAVVKKLNAAGRKVGLLKVRLFRPWSIKDFISVLPVSILRIAVLDRTKEPGAVGEPLLMEVMCTIEEARQCGLLPDAFAPTIIGGRYGLGSKEFDPAMGKAIYDELGKTVPKRRFTVGIEDDVTKLSLQVEPGFDLESPDVFRAVFYGLGSDGTVGANKNSIKIIGEETEAFAQAYFVYDSKKSGAMTTSHLRFGPEPIKAPYLVKNARFVGVHQYSFFERYDVLKTAAWGAVLLVNTTYAAENFWYQLPRDVQETVIEKALQIYVIDAYGVARSLGLGARINTIMQTCFFAISGVLPKEEAIKHIKAAIEKTYGKKGPKVVQSNFAAVDAAFEHLYFVDHANVVTAPLPAEVGKGIDVPDFVEKVTRVMIRDEGDYLPVSAFPVDGVWPTGTTKYEKRNIAFEIPVWDPDLCIQCNKCAFVCPHAAIRAKFYPTSCREDAPASFKSTDFKSRENPGYAFTIQVAPEDCTGCTICVDVCPGKSREDPTRKAIRMKTQAPLKEQEMENFDFFIKLPQPRPEDLDTNLKGSQFRQPLFEFSGACAGCGETPYIKLLTQLYGDRLLMANATGCSSIFGGNLPSTPYTTNEDGRGPAWANSLFEDNAEFGLGLRLAADQRKKIARRLLAEVGGTAFPDLVEEILHADQSTDTGLAQQRERVKVVREWLKKVDTPVAHELDQLADYLVDKSVWIVGGDGWAYDIGFGGLDHVLASGANVNVLVLDTGTYSNTGGQQSKATPMGAVAKFAAAGKALPKKDLGMQAMMYGHIYVAQVALGAKDTQTVQAFNEAASYDGPSLIIAYAHCVSHGFGLDEGLGHQKAAVEAGVHPLYRFDPRKRENGEPLLRLDSKKPKITLAEFMANEGRFQMLKRRDPERAEHLCECSEQDILKRYKILEEMTK